MHKFPLRIATGIVFIHFSSITVKTSAIKPYIITSPLPHGNNDGRQRSHCLTSTTPKTTTAATTTACINKLRGGGGSYQSNPNHHQNNSPTLGDVDKDGFYRVTTTFQSPIRNNSNNKLPPLTQTIKNYFVELHKYSPTLFHGTLSSIVLFFAWQLFPTDSFVSKKVLQNHFMTSYYNVVRTRRYHALILSAFSHASFRHIAMNLYGFLTFGRSVKQILLQNNGGGGGLVLGGLCSFVIMAAVFGNLTFLAFDGGQGSCVGLSGVTLALLAFDSLVYPTKELRLFVSFFPITLPAYYLFLGLIGFSIMGMLGLAGRSNVAHSTHLGGLVYGYLYYEAFKRGWPRLWDYRLRKAYRALRGN